MKKLILWAGAVAAGLFAAPVTAGIINVSANLSSTPDGANFDYTITLTNLATSTDSVETFWYAWVPGKDFLATSPLSVAPPAGWTDLITHIPNVATNGFAIQFKTSTAPLLPGHSLDFSFTSADTPAMVEGLSTFYAGTPVGTSFVYQGQPFQGDSLQFLATPSVPEPSSLALGAFGLLATCGGGSLLRRRSRRREALAARPAR